MGWEPILDGPLADEAWRAVRQIADEIMAAKGERHRPDDLTLFWAYCSGALDDEVSAQRYDDATAALVERIEQGFGGLALYGGLSGAAFTLAHVSDGGVEEFLGAVDETLAEALATGPWRRDYDLIAGLTGFGVYLLERLASAEGGAPAARRALGLLVDRLDEMSERVASGVTWHTPPELLPEWQRVQSPQGYYNLGVAHGVPGVIAVLGRIAALDESPPRAAGLCAEATAWVASHRLPFDPRGRFPSMANQAVATGAAHRSRSAWCYGDPGIAVAMWSAATRTATAAEPWRELALESARRPAELCGVIDGGLCHGAFGLAHLFNRCYQASGDATFRDAARAWIERGLALRRPGEGIAGFLAMSKLSPDQEPVWVTAPEFLEGAAGIGLALLAALRAEEPGWDRLLACDLPPRGAEA